MVWMGREAWANQGEKRQLSAAQLSVLGQAPVSRILSDPREQWGDATFPQDCGKSAYRGLLCACWVQAPSGPEVGQPYRSSGPLRMLSAHVPWVGISNCGCPGAGGDRI